MLNKMQEINQFRHVIKSIKHEASFIGLNDDKEPIYDKNITYPIIEAIGTVKIHGTNAGVSYHKGEIYAQKKKGIITPTNDNAGFASFVEYNKDFFKETCQTYATVFDINTDENILTVQGEWAGKGIQKGVAVSEIEKSFFIIGVKIKPIDNESASYWLDEHNIFMNYFNSRRVYNIEQFWLYKIIIDFNEPLLSQNKMIEMMLEVEKECPVGKFFGISGIGEGIVFTCKYKNNRHTWKVKGDKYAGASKVKKLKPVDDEKINKINEIVDKVTPMWRLVQMYDETFDIINGGVGDIKKTGDYLRAVINDVWKEDNDIIVESGLTSKDINAKISNIARKYFMNRLNEEAGLK